MGTIYMSLRFVDQPFPFFKFLREVLHANETEEHAGARYCRPEEARRRRWGGGEGPGESCAPRGKLDSARGSLSSLGHAHRCRRLDGFTTTSWGGGGKAGAVVLELRRAGGVAAELEASSA